MATNVFKTKWFDHINWTPENSQDLIHGYMKNHFKSSTPTAISAICIKMFDEIFYWKFTKKEFNNFLKGNELKLNSDIFMYEDIKFQCNLCLLKNILYYSSNEQASDKIIGVGFCWRILSMPERYKFNKKYIKIRYKLSCKELHKLYESTQTKVYIEKIYQNGHGWSDSFMPISECHKLNSFLFKFYIECKDFGLHRLRKRSIDLAELVHYKIE